VGWDAPLPKKTGGSSPRKQPGTLPIVPVSKNASAATSASRPQGHVVVRDGYSYMLDSTDRTTSVTGTLRLASNQRRSRSAQAAAGGSDRLTTDDGGHYIAVRFNGPIETFDHFAQDANFNRGGYRVLEDQWAQDTKAGKQVYVSITPIYTGSSRRPAKINVVFSINGQRSFRNFPNISKGISHGK
jgi:hypothetical protein